MRLVVAALLLVVAGGCSALHRYSNELVTSPRTLFTRAPAAVGGSIGFAVGLPLSVVALPVTTVVYRSQPPETREKLSTFLFPSWVLWKVGSLVGAPFDAVEWVMWRSWQRPPAISAEERERIESRWDGLEFTEYPVTPIYPR
ncbi:MAG TPA: hypothetical protein ENI87_05905 [bacterium]|nr:hypothetical protein [bacterium]